ncbi:unnamed protein product [Urochloa decumbens]
MPGQDEKHFQNELQNLMRLKHQNIVGFVGYCCETQREHVQYDGRIVIAERTSRALCFEYLQNGSLHRYLEDEFHGFDWLTRYKIIKGTCEGLKYLHVDLKEPILHLDLKPDNILLDENMLPKLADFGLSKLFSEEQTRVTQSYIGTRGYLPPEYIENNVISKKFDIFSLGVVMLKVIAGRNGRSNSAEMTSKEFINLVHGNWRKRLQDTLTGSPLEAYCQQVKTCIEIALKCVEIKRHKRPNIVDICYKLNETETIIAKRFSQVEKWEKMTMQFQEYVENTDRIVAGLLEVFEESCYSMGTSIIERIKVSRQRSLLQHDDSDDEEYYEEDDDV